MQFYLSKNLCGFACFYIDFNHLGNEYQLFVYSGHGDPGNGYPGDQYEDDSLDDEMAAAFEEFLLETGQQGH